MNEPLLPGRFLHQIELPVRWADMDAIGHINNVMYLRYCEIARLSWHETLGGPRLGEARETMVIVNVFCEFLVAARYPADLRVTMHGGAPGRSSFETYYAIEDIDNGTLYAKGSAKIVWTDQVAEKSIPLPRYVRDRLEQA